MPPWTLLCPTHLRCNKVGRRRLLHTPPTTRWIAEFPWNNSDMHDGVHFIGKPNEKEWPSTGAVFAVECPYEYANYVIYLMKRM